MAGFSSESGLCFNEANESFTAYEERFAQFIEASGIEEGKQWAVFLFVVGAMIFSLLTYLVARKKPFETPLADILKALRDFYVPKKNVVSAAHGEQLNWAKAMDIVNNFECATTSLRTFQQTPLRTDSVSSHEGKACARGTAEKTRDREEILGARETTFNTCLGEEHPARETANQGNSSGRPCPFTESTTAEGETLDIAKEPASMGPLATGLKRQSALGDSRRSPGSSSQTDLEEPKNDDSLRTFQQTPLRTDSVSSHQGKTCARGTAEKTRDREEILGARETTFNTCLGEEHPARETANQGNSSGRPCPFPDSTTAEGDTLDIRKEPASMGPLATGLKCQLALGDSRRPPGSSSQTDLEEPKNDDRIQGANKIKNQINNKNIFTPLSTGNPAIYELNLKSIGNDQGYIKDFGSEVLGKHNKTIMLLGATGSGKTTLINGMINYILGVEWEDEWRFKLIDEVTSKTQAESQTSEVTAYQIHHNEDFQVPYSLTIIDTPGFGDTRGIKQDKEITEKIRQFFTRQDGIASIDAVCFVVQSALARLTHTQKYIFEAVLSIFGKDIASNIISMITFADGQKPPVLEAIRAAKIPCATKEDESFLHFKFNNSALYAPNKQADNDEGSFDQMFWKMGEGSMKRFFNNLNTMETQSLQLTKEVLTERKQLEATVEGVQPLIKMGLSKLNEIQETKLALDQHQSAINANKDFTYEVEITVSKKVELKTGVHVTNCFKCNYTCHDNCGIADDAKKKYCVAMKNSYCTVCSGNCIWDIHYNMKYKFEIEMKKEKRTYENLRKQYEEALGKKMSAEEIVKQLEEEYEEVQLNVFEMTDKMAKSISRLQEIALRPDPLSTPDYIELLIEAEKRECKPGYKKRLAELQNVLEGAVIVNKVTTGQPLNNQENKMSLGSRFIKWLGFRPRSGNSYKTYDT